MEDLHHRLIRIGLEALAEDFGYRLAGGYAVQAHRLVSRVSDDVDLFTPIGRAEGELPQAIARLAEAYRTAGYLVQVTQQAQLYARLHVTDPDSGSQSKVELVGDLLHHPPVESQGSEAAYEVGERGQLRAGRGDLLQQDRFLRA